ncbi:MAG: PqqD family protein [Lachnospiraceae bacterium]|nr:PqqD family protein [Lachnospiraceae bacterium]
MKLKGDFELIQKDEFEKEVIAHGEAEERLGNILRSGETTNYIFQFLMEDTTEDEVVKKMTETFEAPEDQIREDVEMIVRGLRTLGFLEEN